LLNNLIGRAPHAKALPAMGKGEAMARGRMTYKSPLCPESDCQRPQRNKS
jgi:hypothetical protein